MFDMEKWLDERLERFDCSRAHRICWLIRANRGILVHGWGFLSGDSYGHQVGLEQDEALELIEVGAFLNGLQAAGVDAHDAVLRRLDSYNQQVETRNAG